MESLAEFTLKRISSEDPYALGNIIGFVLSEVDDQTAEFPYPEQLDELQPIVKNLRRQYVGSEEDKYAA